VAVQAKAIASSNVRQYHHADVQTSTRPAGGDVKRVNGMLISATIEVAA
jgi:hypothetical protein